ncbi:MAG: rhodanese-like domain-containing protein [Firmicutes bacterium]|nr:rhodanese-like domain-containing protein [Bacillota bacterium]
MKRLLPPLLLLLLFCCGCTGASEEKEITMNYQIISQEEAKRMMEEEDVLILDVRQPHEYESGHIPNAVLLTLQTIDAETAAAVIPAKDTKVLVYCRSGNRSKTASEKLVDLGYTEVYEFGGINSWPYEIEV